MMIELLLIGFLVLVVIAIFITIGVYIGFLIGRKNDR